MKRTRRRISDAKKIAAVEALKSGLKYREVQDKFGCVSSQLHRWRQEYDAGELGNAKIAAKAVRPAQLSDSEPKGKTPEAVFGSRVHRAIALLQEAEDIIKAKIASKEIVKEDTAHLHAILALRLLQGDGR